VARGLVSPRIHASPPTFWSVLPTRLGSDWVYHKLGNAPVLQSGTGSWVLSGQSGVRHPLSPAIRLGLRNPRKKESKKKERWKYFQWCLHNVVHVLACIIISLRQCLTLQGLQGATPIASFCPCGFVLSCAYMCLGLCLFLVRWSVICCQDGCLTAFAKGALRKEYLGHNFDEQCLGGH